MIQKYTQPTAEELKEFYLCGIRLAYSKENELKINLSDPFGLKAYKCEYCPSWHKIPSFHNEETLIKEAEAIFAEHMNSILGVSSTVPTSAVVILSIN